MTEAARGTPHRPLATTNAHRPSSFSRLSSILLGARALISFRHSEYATTRTLCTDKVLLAEKMREFECDADADADV